MHEVEYVVGVPSGEVLDIKPTMVNFLKQRGLIFYDIRYRMYLYSDLDYDELRLVLFNLQIDQHRDKNKGVSHNSRFSHRVLDFMSTQKYIKTYSIDSESNVLVKGDIIVVGDIHFEALPFSFSEVDGNFIIRNCRLQNLRGAPRKVSGNFNVSGNELFDLIDGPDYVGGNYDCSDNVLTTLAGSPDVIKGDFDCCNNLLQNLKGSPIKVWGIFDCSKNKHLKTLVDVPFCNQIISDIN